MKPRDKYFLLKWQDRLTQDKGSGWHQYAGKDVLQRVRDIAFENFEDGLFPKLVGCGGCDEVVDMCHHYYFLFDIYLKTQV